jgi:hypothetical protein
MIDFGQGDTATSMQRPSWIYGMGRYIDLAQELTKGASYHDFEGLTDPASTHAMLANPTIASYFKPGEREPFIRDLLAHWYYDNIDEGGYTPSIEECQVFIHTLDYLFTSRYWMRIDAQEVS